MNERYDRNRRIPGFGEAGQEVLLKARVLVVGAGGLGSPAILYLAGAGVGTLGVADGDTVSLGNLQRQTLYTMDDIGRSKAEAACRAVRARNPEIAATPFCEMLTPSRMEELFPSYDCILDCTDRAAVKYAINDVCAGRGIAFVHAGVLGMAGQLLSFAPGHACLRCALPQPDPAPLTANELGILGAAAGVIGALQAAEAVKLITGAGAPLFDTLLHVDVGSGEFLRVHIPPAASCPACAKIPEK